MFVYCMFPSMMYVYITVQNCGGSCYEDVWLSLGLCEHCVEVYIFPYTKHVCGYNEWADLIILHVQIPHLSWSQDSIVSIVTSLCAWQYGIGIPSSSRYFSLVQNSQTGFGSLSTLYFMSDCLYNRICGPAKWYMYVCMYVCIFFFLFFFFKFINCMLHYIYVTLHA
jgi:hypothetical protein